MTVQRYFRDSVTRADVEGGRDRATDEIGKARKDAVKAIEDDDPARAVFALLDWVQASARRSGFQQTLDLAAARPTAPIGACLGYAGAYQADLIARDGLRSHGSGVHEVLSRAGLVGKMAFLDEIGWAYDGVERARAALAEYPRGPEPE